MLGTVRLEISAAGLERSFGFLAALRRPCLRAGGDLVVWRAARVRAVLEVLVVIKVAVRVAISVLLWRELVHLLGARSKLIWASVTPHGH